MDVDVTESEAWAESAKFLQSCLDGTTPCIWRVKDLIANSKLYVPPGFAEPNCTREEAPELIAHALKVAEFLQSLGR